MQRTVAITLPLPHRGLSPNARMHYMAKSKLTKGHRNMATAAALAVTTDRPKWKIYSLHYAFTFPNKRRRDNDNLIATCKAYLDGIRDAGIIEDDSDYTMLPMTRDVGSPKLIITVTNLDPQPKGPA